MASFGHRRNVLFWRIEPTAQRCSDEPRVPLVSKRGNFLFSVSRIKRHWNLNRLKIHHVTHLFLAIVLFFSWPTNGAHEASFESNGVTRRPWPSHEFLQSVIKIGEPSNSSSSFDTPTELNNNTLATHPPVDGATTTEIISKAPESKSYELVGLKLPTAPRNTESSRARDTTSLSVLQEAQLKASERRLSDTHFDLDIPVEVSTGESVPFRVFRPKSKLPPLPSDLSGNFNGGSSTRNEYVQDGPSWWTEAEEAEGWNSFPTKAPELMRLTWPYTKYPTTNRRTWSTSPFINSHRQSTSAPTQAPGSGGPQKKTSTTANPVVHKASRKTTSTVGHRETQMQPVPIIIVTTPSPQYVSILNSNQISNHHWGSVGAVPLDGFYSASPKFPTSSTTTSPTFPSGPTTVWYKPVINHNYGPSGSAEVQNGFGAKTPKDPTTSKAPANFQNSVFLQNKTSDSPILFRVWNLVNGSLQLTSETSVPQWLVEHIQLNSSSTLLNTNELPRAIQRLVAEQGILDADSIETSEVQTEASGSSNALRKRQGLPSESEDGGSLGSWHNLNSPPKNKHDFRRAPPQAIPVVHYVLWPPGGTSGGGGGKFESSFQQRPFRHGLAQDELSEDYSHSQQDASWTRIKEYLDRQKFANSYPFLLPLTEPNSHSPPTGFLHQDVSNLIAASLILSYLNQDTSKNPRIPPNLSSILNSNSPPLQEPPYSQSSSSSLFDFLSKNPVVSAVEDTLDRLVPSLSHRHKQGKRPGSKNRPKYPLRDRTGLSFLRPKTTTLASLTNDEEEDTKIASTTSQTPVNQADKRKTLLTKKLVKKKLKKLKKKKKKKKKHGYFPEIDFNVDFGIDVVDLVKKKFVYLLTLKYAPIIVLTLATLAPTLLVYTPLLLKAFSKSWKHLDDDGDNGHQQVHNVVHNGPPGGWGWQQPHGSGPPPPGPSSAYSHLNMQHQGPPPSSGPPMDHVPGPPYQNEGPPPPQQQQQYPDYWYGTSGPPMQPPGLGTASGGYPPTGPFQYTENDAEGYMQRIREIGRGLGELIGRQMNDPANQHVLKTLYESKKDGVSSILNKMFEFRVQDFLPKFKDSEEQFQPGQPQYYGNGRSSKSSKG